MQELTGVSITEMLKFKGLFKVEDAKGNTKYQAIFIGEQAELVPFEHKENDEMSEIRLWDMQEDIGYVDECDVRNLRFCDFGTCLGVEVGIKESEVIKMYHSYVMGIDESIYTLENQGFEFNRDGGNFMVSFPEEKAAIWEEFISAHLELEYWNEYLTENGAVFLFHLQDGIKRYEVNDFINDEVLGLCERLCECKFESIKRMLSDNHFYKRFIS